jgi:hypothetical protein
MTVSLRDLSLLTFDSGAVGGDQEWYSDPWQKRAGCGPVAASNIIWYLTRSQCHGLCPISEGNREEFIELMKVMFDCVTPTMRGVHSGQLFVTGMKKYMKTSPFCMDAHILKIPRSRTQRPAWEHCADFVRSSIELDNPVAFLNLSSGDIEVLDSWHWVTILEIDPATGHVTISDQSKSNDIDLSLWLRSTQLGGAFVSLNITKEPQL